MNDIEFIETLKQKRNACDYSQSRLAQELQISRQNLNEIENGKTKASKEMKHILLHYLDYCNCTQPFTLTIDYLRVRSYHRRIGNYKKCTGNEKRIFYT